MKFSELANYQHEWEKDRGISNPNHNLDRIQDELDEARVEHNPAERLAELIDVLIIACGGMSKLCDELGWSYDTIDQMVQDKLKINDEKYNLEYFETMDPEKAQAYARFVWSFNPPDWGNDVY